MCSCCFSYPSFSSAAASTASKAAATRRSSWFKILKVEHADVVSMCSTATPFAARNASVAGAKGRPTKSSPEPTTSISIGGLTTIKAAKDSGVISSTLRGFHKKQAEGMARMDPR